MSRVVDNTVLTNFCLVDRLDILHTLFGKVYLTHEVREEVLRGLDEGYNFMSRAEREVGVR
jgi:predicted nucleic acid-binding protein